MPCSLASDGDWLPWQWVPGQLKSLMASPSRKAIGRTGPAKNYLPKRAVLYITGDWGEFVHSLGFPSWNDGLRPCWACAGCGEDLMATSGCSDAGLRWHCNTPTDYDAACLRCERRVHLYTDSQRDELVKCLAFDKRPTGARGRALAHSPPGGNFPQLQPDDRLEPDDVLRDIGSLEDVVTPATVTVWRRSSKTIARHKNPLFSNELGNPFCR